MSTNPASATATFKLWVLPAQWQIYKINTGGELIIETLEIFFHNQAQYYFPVQVS